MYAHLFKPLYLVTLFKNSKSLFRSQNLKEQIQSLTNEHKATLQDLNKELKDFKDAIDEQRQQVQKEAEQRINVQERLREAEIYIEELKAKNTEIENSRPNPGTSYKLQYLTVNLKPNFACK